MSVGQYYAGTSGASNTFGTLHGVMDSEPWVQPTQTLMLPGVIGVSQLLDYRKERQLSCDLRIHGYSDYASIAAALETIDSNNQTITGRVFMTGTLVMNYDNCTFMGFSRGPIKYDGSGNHGWWVEGRLHWVQRSPN